MKQPAQPVPAAVAPARIDRLRIRHLKLLELISSHGSLTGAARQLGISQPSATKMLHEMEHALRVPLVDRGTRGGVLTDAGMRALERMRIAISAIAAVGEPETVQAGRPLVRIGMLRLVGVSILPRLVHQMERAGSLPRIQLHEGAVKDLMAMLHGGEIDCVIGRLEGADVEPAAARLDVTLLNDEPYEVACAPGHALARRRKVGLETLRTLPWIATPRGTYTREVFDAAFARLGVSPPLPVIESPSFHASFTILSLCPSFLTVAPRTSVQYYAALGTVSRVRLAVPFPEDRMVFVTRRDLLQMPAVAAMKRHVATLSR